AFPPFLIVAAVLTIATLLLLWRSPDSQQEERYALISCLAVLCFPNTHQTTLVLIFPAMLTIFQGGLRRGWPLALAVGFVAFQYVWIDLLPLDSGWTAVMCWMATAALLMSRK